MSNQTTTLTFFRYQKFWNKLWAFGTMQFMHRKMKRTPGLKFYKLMGSGKKDFNPLPDWEEYAVLQIWENETYANDYFLYAEASKDYKKHADEMWTVYLKNITAKGEWSGQQPFEKQENLDKNNPLIAVITRATIKTSRLITFWKYVPKSQTYLQNNQGLLFTKGIGEVPLAQMATFSIWKNKEYLMDFAYQHQAHRGAIKKTRELQWYDEELFSRFQPYKSIGLWKGKQQLPEIAD